MKKQGRFSWFIAGLIDQLPFVAALTVARGIDHAITRYVSEAASWTFIGGFTFGLVAAYFWMWGPRRK